MYDIQVIINLIFGDKEIFFDVFVVLVVFVVFFVFDINFDGFIFEVCVVCIDGEFVVNLNCELLVEVDFDIIVVVIMENIMMVEGEVKECLEKDLVEVMKVGYEVIKV